MYDLSDRRYDPETGHFPSPDRLWETDRATSPYAYCADNPVRLADPTGMQAAPTIPTDGKEGFVEGIGKDLYNDFSSGIFDTYICPVCPTLRLLIEPAKTVGGYVETFKNATGMNGGGAAARFWTTKAIETVVFGGAARVAAARPVAPTTAAEATPAAEPAAPAEAAAQKTGPATPAAAGNSGSGNTAGTSSPSIIVTPKGQAIIVPEGATGPTPTRAPGAQYTGGSGGKGLNPRTTGVRIMEENANQGPRAVYMNQNGQTVNPYTGKTVPNSDLSAHWYLWPW
ncbi:MAG: hypothetical protein JST22_03085 [Bacteroidetes bacterium]|nr:hypothetical protein [Bacteroidota bacterium]